MLDPAVVAFGLFLPALMVHEVSRTEELAERQHAHSVDHAAFDSGVARR